MFRTLFALGLTLTACAMSSVMTGASASEAPVDADLYVLLSPTTQTQPCEPRSGSLRKADNTAIATLVSDELLPLQYSVHDQTQLAGQRGPDYLQWYLKNDPKLPKNVLLATYCKTADIYTVSVIGYMLQGTKITSTGAVSGSFDALRNSKWTSIFAPAPTATPMPMVISNIAFLPVGNDTTNTINPRLMRNLPLTQISTPLPAPTASPAPGTPIIPTTRLDECHTSPYHMMISGRVVISSATSELSRAVVTGAALKESAPSPWGTYYTILGAGLGALYTPNSTDIGADVFLCPIKDPNNIYLVGGGDGHITGHSTSPALGVDTLKVQRATDLATTDLENQLACIVRSITTNYSHISSAYPNSAAVWMKLNLKDSQMDAALPKDAPDPSNDFKLWCDGDAKDPQHRPGYFARLVPPQPIAGPINADMK